MPKIRKDRDERYPFYSVIFPGEQFYREDEAIEISDEKLEWIKKVMEEFEKVQDYLENLEENEPN